MIIFSSSNYTDDDHDDYHDDDVNMDIYCIYMKCSSNTSYYDSVL